MNGDVKIDIGLALPYYTERVLALFGKDSATVRADKVIARQQRMAVEQASFVQCIGMAQPVPIELIYQSTNLMRSHDERSSHSQGITNVWALINDRECAIIYAGPGCGKTTLLHWLYVNLIGSKDQIPFLFTLRLPGGTDALVDFVERLEDGVNLKGLKDTRIVLLVDGYDEVSVGERKTVSEALLRFKGLKRGLYLLTCRTFYDVYELKAPRFEIAPFGDAECRAFISAFANAYGTRMDADQFLSDLKSRGFSDFACHPLMLALICILRTGPLETIPDNSIGLLRRALDTLTLRWDQAKAVKRDTSLAVDGDGRVRCMMRVAYFLRASEAPEAGVILSINEELELAQYRISDSRVLLREMAQWYGMLVPTGSGTWKFVHKTLHDYLAARFWVESGTFDPLKVGEWNARAAYACCLIPDATIGVCASLRGPDLSSFLECLYNRARFSTETVSRALVLHFDNRKPYQFLNTRHLLMHTDFIHLASDEFVVSLATFSEDRETEGRKAVALYAFSEILRRGIKIERRRIPPSVLKLAEKSDAYVVERRATLGNTFRDFDIQIENCLIDS